MSFVLSDQRENNFQHYGQRYEQYLKSVQERFPPNAWRLANSQSWYDFGDHQSPHDAWLEEARIIEPSEGENHEKRQCSLEIKLLGAYHDRQILLRYPTIYRYSLASVNCQRGMGDWRYDEFRLSDDGHLVHEVEWADGSRWVIECDDIECHYVPLP